MQNQEINPDNPLNNPEIKNEILKELSIKELNEISAMMHFSIEPSKETWFKWNKIKNKVLARRFPETHIDPSDVIPMN